MKTEWCLRCDKAANSHFCGGKDLIRSVEVKLPLTARVEKRIKFLQEKLQNVERALREEPKDDRPTHTRAGAIGITVEGSREPFESRSWVISWRKDEAAYKAQIADYQAIRAIVEASEFLTAKPDLSVCVERLQNRDRADWGSSRACGRPTIYGGKAGLCKLHHPTTAPKRDSRGRIISSKEVA